MEDSQLLIDKALKKLMPNGYYYSSIPYKNLKPSEDEYARKNFRVHAMNCMWENDEDFYKTIKNKRGGEFKRELDIELSNYSKRAKDLTKWFSHTEGIIKLLKNKYLEYDFNEWKKTKQTGTLPDADIKKISENSYPNIFSGINDCGYKLFSIWHKKFKNDENNHVANYSFIIRTMVSDHLILDLKHSAYLEFLGKHYIQISRIKTISNCTTKLKEELYLELKESIYTTTN